VTALILLGAAVAIGALTLIGNAAYRRHQARAIAAFFVADKWQRPGEGIGVSAAAEVSISLGVVLAISLFTFALAALTA
jgi:predicted acetyltransferase